MPMKVSLSGRSGAYAFKTSRQNSYTVVLGLHADSPHAPLLSDAQRIAA
jgi:hypothetical protein